MYIVSAALTPILLVSIIPAILSSPRVTIHNGTLEGSYMFTRKGREIAAFRGIRYAQAPIGKLRFELAQPANSWTGIRSAKEDGEICLQYDMFVDDSEFVGSEDCLYLNVYTGKSSDVGKDLKPVMVWVHGGGFATGAGHSTLFNPKFLLDKDIVLVSFNYRLGPLGFLSTADDILPGNQGLKDQVQALRWIHENIAAFGGDPNSITIFGESAGGASTHYLMLSPLAKGLFHRVISQSGTVFGPWALSTPSVAKKQAHRLAKQLKCPTTTSEQLRDCLKAKDVMEVLSADMKWLVFAMDPLIPFKPVVEPDRPGAFLPKYPIEILKNADLNDVPWMTGLTSHEGALRTANLYGQEHKKYVQELDKNFSELAPITFLYESVCPKTLGNEVADKLRKFYIGDKRIDEYTRFNLLDLYSDVMFTASTDTSIAKHMESLGSPIYYYYFTYRGSNSWSKVLGDKVRDHGVAHGDELLYLFPIGENISPEAILTQDDKKMIDIMTTLWYNFAKSGNPTPEITSELPVKWKPIRTSAKEYLLIQNPQNIGMSENLWKKRRQFYETLPCPVGLAPSSELKDIKEEL